MSGGFKIAEKYFHENEKAKKVHIANKKAFAEDQQKQAVAEALKASKGNPKVETFTSEQVAAAAVPLTPAADGAAATGAAGDAGTDAAATGATDDAGTDAAGTDTTKKNGKGK